ncbi:diaminopimelate epimerase [Streptomyces sp. GC420]|uniref:diaminopimelate epimerase n=1 Tax=Streptomyces sp. GC420 TaxID=2697568 RepID=UPI00141530F1|nr:diaminopimelate epimerase [Streptomyces sp. GC420]NBM16008.1 diaminopimelate epimerase [Streptomyces sp. GC420]
MVDFVKYQALGNDYLIVDPRYGDTDLGPEPAPEAVRLLCDRHHGVGADGLIFGPLEPAKPDTPVSLRIFNADGSECGMSGNGLRMFALYLAERYVEQWRAGRPFTVRTRGGDAEVRIVDFVSGLVRVDMGLPHFTSAEGNGDSGAAGVAVPVAGGGPDEVVTVTDLHLGVPHTVVFRDRIDGELAQRLGPALAWHPRYPEGTNVEFVRIHDDHTLDTVLWERAAGHVPASGSGACAAAAVAYARGLVGRDVRVRMPGGEADVIVARDGRVSLTGTAREVMRGCLSPSLRSELTGRRPVPELSRRRDA